MKGHSFHEGEGLARLLEALELGRSVPAVVLASAEHDGAKLVSLLLFPLPRKGNSNACALL